MYWTGPIADCLFSDSGCELSSTDSVSHEANSTSSCPYFPLIYLQFERKSLQFVWQEPIFHTSEIWSPTSFDLYRLQCSDWAMIHCMWGVTTKDQVIAQISLGCVCTLPPISQFTISHRKLVGCLIFIDWEWWLGIEMNVENRGNTANMLI